MNWLNPDYPAYPDDWPTDKVYDRYDDQGNDLCPCLYAKQHYTRHRFEEGMYSEILYPPSAENNTSNDYRNIMYNFFVNRSDKYARYVSGNSSASANQFFGKIFDACHFGDGREGYYQNWKQSWYWSNRYNTSMNYYCQNQPFTESTLNRGWGPYKMTCNSGFMPEFGFYGFTARSPLPTDYIITENITTDVDGSKLASFTEGRKDDFVADNLRQSLYGNGAQSMHIGLVIRSTAGSTDPNSDYYNPFKVDFSSFTENDYNRQGLLPKLLSDAWDDATDPNPLNGFIYRGQLVGSSFMRHTMWYDYYIHYPEWDEGRYVADGDFIKSHIDSGFYNVQWIGDDGRNVYSPDTIERINDFFDHKIGKLGKVADYAKLEARRSQDLIPNYNNYDGEIVRTSIEKYIESNN